MADSNITIVGLQAIGGASQIVLTWAADDPNAYGLSYLRYQKAEVKYSLSEDMSSPVSLGYATTAKVDLPVPRGETQYYQVRAIDQSDQLGEWSSAISAREISGEVDINPTGFWKHPSGLILQWGISDLIPGGGFLTQYYPVVFPNRCFFVIPLSAVPPGSGTLYEIPLGPYDQEKFLLTTRRIQSGSVDSPEGINAYYLAIGY